MEFQKPAPPVEHTVPPHEDYKDPDIKFNEDPHTALSLFYERYYSQILGLTAATFYIPRHLTPEDLINQAFTNIVSASQSERPPNLPTTIYLRNYLLRTIHNLSISELRRRAPSVVVDYDLVELQLVSDQDVESQALEWVGYEGLQELLNRINPRYKQALLLKHFVGLKDKQSAEQMGITDAAFRVLLHRAHEACITIINKDPELAIQLT